MAKSKGKYVEDKNLDTVTGGYVESFTDEDGKKRYGSFDNLTNELITVSNDERTANILDQVYHIGKEEGYKQALDGKKDTNDTAYQKL